MSRLMLLCTGLLTLAAACGDDGAGDDTTAPVDTATAPDAADGADDAGPDAAGDTTDTPDTADTLDVVRPPNLTCRAWDRPPPGYAARLSPWLASPVPDLVTPVALTAVPNVPGRYVVADRAGFLVSFSDAADLAARVALDLRGQGGLSTSLVLLGLARHPDFPTPPELYVVVADVGQGGLRLVRLVTVPDGLAIDAVAVLPTPAAATPGGWLAFSPLDDHLYIGIGAAGADDASVLSAPTGKVWRVALDAGEGVIAAPGDNPFATSATPQVWATGFRDPASGGFDRASGDLWIVDRGATVDELDRVTAGAGYGHPCFEGPPGATSACGDATTTEPPAYRVTRGDAQGHTVGGLVYRGAALPGLVGTLLYARPGGGLYGLVGGLPPQVVVDADAPPLHALAEDADGEVIGLGADLRLWKLGAPAPSAHPIPQHLGDTGCFEGAEKDPVAALVAYDVNVELWSDGAQKQRWFALPDGAAVDVTSSGEWSFPIGAVLVKEFTIEGAKVETRFLVRHEDGDWAGYTYAWQDGDATLVDAAGATRALAGGASWTYPSRGQCTYCHSAPTLDYARERPLGLDSAQLDDGDGQLERLAAGGWIVPQGDLHPARAMPRIDDESASLEDRARAYLDANCANCHQPQGPGPGPDFRYERALADAGVCDATPLGSSWGIADARIVAPGEPARSLVSFRMHAAAPGTGRMPPLASAVVDPAGTALVDAWITSLTTCP